MQRLRHGASARSRRASGSRSLASAPRGTGADLAAAPGPLHRVARAGQRRRHRRAAVRGPAVGALGPAGRGREPPGGDAVVAINAFIGAHDDHVLLYHADLVVHGASAISTTRCPTIRRELSPVARVSNTLRGFRRAAVARRSTSVTDLIAMVTAQPGKLNYTTATGMTDFIYDGYFKSDGLAITRVPYRDVVRAAHRSRRRAASRPMSARSRSCSRTSRPAGRS